MKVDQGRGIARLITRDRKWWNIRFYDQRIKEFVLIDLKTPHHGIALRLFKNWLFDKVYPCNITAPWPVMGMSLQRAIFDVITAPDVAEFGSSDEEMAIYANLVRGFGHKSIQQVNEEDCRLYAEARRSELLYEDIDEASLRDVHRQIRRELKALRCIARYARRWQRITAKDMPDIQLNLIPTRMSYREMIGPIRTTGARRRVQPMGAWAYIQRTLSRRWILCQERNSS